MKKPTLSEKLARIEKYLGLGLKDEPCSFCKGSGLDPLNFIKYGDCCVCTGTGRLPSD